MDLRDYLRVLRSRWLFILICTLVGVGIAALVTATTTPIYTAQSQVFVSAADDQANVSSALTGSSFSQQMVKSYLAVAESSPVAQAVIDDLGLTMTPTQLADKVTATVPLNSVVITLTASDPSPQLAQQIANSLATQFSAAVTRLSQPLVGGASLVKVTVVQPAELPKTPSSPRPKINLALGLLVGLAIGVGGAVLRETLDTRVKTVATLHEIVDRPTLGVLALDPDVPKHPLITQTAISSRRAEAFRQIRTNLQYVDPDRHPRSFVITSSVPQEGKSTTAVNLAIALAQAGQSVVLVEGDLRRPRVADMLGLDSAAGLTDILVGRAHVTDVLQHWGGPGGLSVLASGTLPPNPSELLGSQHMVDLLRELERWAIVLVDAPPLIPVTDAAVLSAAAGGALLVVALNRVHRDQVRLSVDNLESVGGRLLGTIANMAPPTRPGRLPGRLRRRLRRRPVRGAGLAGRPARRRRQALTR